MDEALERGMYEVELEVAYNYEVAGYDAEDLERYYYPDCKFILHAETQCGYEITYEETATGYRVLAFHQHVH